jgi:hypothetical protein
MGAKTARRRKHRLLHQGRMRYGESWVRRSYLRARKYARREIRRFEREEARSGYSLGFRVHPEFGLCEAELDALGYHIVGRHGKFLILSKSHNAR